MRKGGDSEEVGVNEAARRLGLTGGEVSRLHGEPGAPKVVRGGKVFLRWPEFPRWRDERLKKVGKPSGLDEARRRRLSAQAELAELELAKARGDLLTISDVERIVSTDYGKLRAQLLSMPGRLAPCVVGVKTMADATAAIDAEVRSVMAELSR